MTESMDKLIDFEPEWEKICKEHHKRVDRINAFKELGRARSELALAELVSGIERKGKEEDWSCKKKGCPAPSEHSTPEHDDYFRQLDFENDK